MRAASQGGKRGIEGGDGVREPDRSVGKAWGNSRLQGCGPVFLITGLRRSMAPMVVAASMIAGSTALAASTGSSAQHLVKQVTESIIEELTSRPEALRENPRDLHELVDRLVLPYFDFERMSRRVLGKRWKTAAPEQRTRFVSAFRSLLVRTYATLLSEYRGQTLIWLDPMPRRKDDEIVVPVRIETTGSPAIRVAYAMHGKGTDWKVFDVAVDGVSLVTNYRSSFRSEIARDGIEGLIARLEAKSLETD